MVVTMTVEVDVEVSVTPSDRRRLEKDYIATKELLHPGDDWFAEEKAMCLVEKKLSRHPFYVQDVTASDVSDGTMMDQWKKLK